MDVDFGDQMTDDGQVEGFGHAGDLQPLGDAADPNQVDHHDVDRVPFDHVTERDDAPDVFAAGDRGRESGGDAGKPGEIVRRRHVLEPEEADPRVLDPAADVDRLLDPPALIDVAHQLDV